MGVRIGDHVLDLAPLAAGAAPELAPVLAVPSLNPLMGRGRPTWSAVRAWVTGLLTDEARRDLVSPHLRSVDEVELSLPFEVADYVDFYCSLHHATNVGRIFRPEGEALAPNWRSFPVGYHGRAGTVVVSGTEVGRPVGVRGAGDVGPTRELDLEAEVGFVVGTGSRLGHPVGTGALADHVFGVTLLNDWSARDVQRYETRPLGPFLGKSFATSVSGWVTPLDALAAAWVTLPGQDPPAPDHLRVPDPAGLDLDLEVLVNGETVSLPPYASTYWSPAQMLAHLTSGGASLRTGDLFASGTVSGPGREQRGSLLELSWGGTEPFAVGGGTRTFLLDGDTVTLRATAPATGGGRLALGEVVGRVVAARPEDHRG